MSRITLLKTFLFALTLLLSNVVWGQTETYTYTTGNGSGTTSEWTYQSTNFTLLHKKNSSSTNIATTYAELRVYTSHSMEVFPSVSGKTITSIEVTTGSSTYATAMNGATVMAGTSSSSATTVTGISTVNGSVTTFDLSSVSGCEYVKFTLAAQSRTLSWKITYTSGAITKVSTPTIVATGNQKTTDNYFNTASIALSSTTAGASIYYTTNGDIPTVASTLYSVPFDITSTTTIKAIAIKSGLDNSSVAEKTFIISTPATATVPYTEAFNNTLGDWITYEVAGTKPWIASVNGASANGYAGGDVESWLISPKFTAIGSGLVLLFNYASKYIGNPISVKMSSNYLGYGNPTSATWTELSSIAAPTVQDNAYTIKSSGNIIAATTGTVYYALVYDNAANPYSDWRITNATVNNFTPPSSPTIEVTEVTIPTFSAFVGNNDTETINVTGSLLTANINITLTGTDAAMFGVNPETITQSSGNASGIVTITYSPTAAGNHTATLRLNSTDATEVTFEISGSATIAPTTPDVFITEVYGGGGNSGAPYTNDFIEIYNNSNSPVDISNWSVVYYAATATGAGTNKTIIPEGKYIPSKKHFLIQGGAGTSTFAALPIPDASGTINASGTAGKIILFNTSVEQTISDLNSIIGNANFVDYVPFGTTATPIWGSAMSSNASNTTSATRKKVTGEYVYTSNIGTDFDVIAPSPENTGLSTDLNNVTQNLQLRTINGNIVFNTSAGKLVNVYNSVGQRVSTVISTEGINTIPVRVRGVVFVKIGSEISKLIVE